jgi:hypothetical protein
MLTRRRFPLGAAQNRYDQVVTGALLARGAMMATSRGFFGDETIDGVGRGRL